VARKPRKMTDDDVISLLEPLRDRAKDHAVLLSEKREEWERWYSCRPYGNERKGWSQTVHPTIYSAVEWMKPGLVEVFTGDFFAFNPVVRQGEDKVAAAESAEKLKRYVRHKLFTEQQGEQTIEDFIHDALVSQYGVFKVCQRDDYDLTSEEFEGGWEAAAAMMQQDPTVANIEPLEEAPMLDAMGFPLVDPMTGEPLADLVRARITRKEVKYSGFSVEAVPPDELRYTPGYKALHDCPLVAHVVKRDLDYIKRQERAGVYKKGSAKLVEDGVNSKDIDRATESEVTSRDDCATGVNTYDDDYRDGTSGLATPNTRVQVEECYVRLDMDGTGLLKPCIVTVCGKVVLRGPVDNPYKSAPFEIGSAFKDPHRIEGKSMAEVLNHRQRVASNLLRGIQDSAAMSTYRGFLTTDARARKVLADMGPGEVALVPQLGVVQELAPTPPPAFILNAFELTLQEIAKESGVNENMQGLDNNALNKTAAGMNMRLSAGMQRQKLYARRIARVFRRVLGRILDVIRLYPPTDDQQILGEDIQLNPQDYQGQYTVTIDVGVGPQDRQEKAAALGQLVMLQMQMGGLVPPEKILATVKAQYEALDIDVEEFLPTPEEIDTMQQLQQQAAQATAERDALQQAIDDHASEAGQGEGQPAPQQPQGPPPAMFGGM
jgi:hypothetical protein